MYPSRPLQLLSHELSAFWHFLCLNLCCYPFKFPNAGPSTSFLSLPLGSYGAGCPCAKGLPLTQFSTTWDEGHMIPSMVSLGLPLHWALGKA